MALIYKLGQDVIKLRSFTRGAWYDINTVLKTCSCPAFAHQKDYRGGCKHLKELGLYRLPPVDPPTYPSFSQALSGLVKCIRLRRPEEAIYWLTYLKRFTEAKQIVRVQRRILICSAEDGLSVPVMERVAANFKTLKNDFRQACAEVVRICKVPNWWADKGGRQFIHDGMVASRQNLYCEWDKTITTAVTELKQSLHAGNTVSALQWTRALGWTKGETMGTTKRAELLLELAEDRCHLQAQRLCQVHLSQKSALSGDSNVLSYAAWLMAGGCTDLSEQMEPVYQHEVDAAIVQANTRLGDPKPMPKWCVDGIHCKGDDPRFAGVWHMMNGCCRAYEHYGRLDPEDKWLPSFLSRDGLLCK